MAIRYRVWQTWQWLTAAPLPDEAWRTLADTLSPAELQLFQRYPAQDRRHAYRVMATLQAGGNQQPALLTAALLHDVGKTKIQLRIWERVMVVLGVKLLPGRAAKWGMGEPAGWRRAFVIKARHPEWGAKMAVAAGSDPLVVELIRRHQEPLPPEPPNLLSAGETDLLLRLLQWADDRS